MTRIHECHLLILLSGDKDVRDAMPSFVVNTQGGHMVMELRGYMYMSEQSRTEQIHGVVSV